MAVCIPKYFFFNITSITVLVVLFAGAVANAGAIEWNGFGSVYYGETFNSRVHPNYFQDTHPQFGPLTGMGLNLSSTISDQFTAAGQFFAGQEPSTNTWSLNANWAYLMYSPSEHFRVKAGRQLFPAFIASEYRLVGYLQPFRSMPAEVSNIAPYLSFDGLSVGSSADVGFARLTGELFGGRPSVFTSGINGNPATPQPQGTYDLLGATLTLEGRGYRVRANMSRATVKLNIPGQPGGAGGAMETKSAHPLINTIGYRIDQYNVVSWGEFGYQRTTDEALNRIFRYNRGGYILLGYRFGSWLPRYTFSQAYQNVFGQDTKVTSHNFGLNYQCDPKVVLKLEYLLSIVPPDSSSLRSDGMFVANGTSETRGSSIFIGLDFIF